MLTNIEVGVQGVGNYLDFMYGHNFPSSGYSLDNVTGLEPPPTNVYYSEYALVPGGRYHSSSVDIRNIVMTVSLKPAPGSGQTVQQLRRDLYHALPPGEMLRMRLHNNGSYEMRVDGYIETLEPSMFAKEPTMQVSIVCPEPYFGPPSTIVMENLEPGRITVDNPGDVPHGYTIRLVFTGSISHTVYIQNLTTGDGVELRRSWRAGETLMVRTIQGRRTATVYNSAGSIVDRIIGDLVVVQDWPNLIRGENELNVSSANDVGNWTWELSHYPQFGGF